MKRLALSVVVLGLLQGCASSVDEQAICGSVASYITPPTSQSLYRVVVTHLDGKPVISRPYYKLTAGKHEFTVAELIESPELKVKLAARKPKNIDVDVKAHLQLHLAAEFNQDRIYTGENTDYWQPVIWQQEPHECEFANPDN
ncbi:MULTISPECIES: hypothetical protein [unclassified Shewanella]|uniref:hypothetical protein n=1 Tax=unclassified Shewanella TaxID=196818 RepID=UPI000C843095|nr:MULTISPECIES: hypothetical protein [unclassified Shewanella]MDO6619874.1 hypothetical protein [Shewanella sp. 6_MG-2023]MDO6641089.1 hypothetical protein [Shewanella sp. 5_MG-2023]MDO6679082.1 hypothetical protein [Shewanella sp. 4_MG-2023]MDO6776371.1 hypothetical protein [Shewanella sp. 3_MG-2023]PMG27028.1 hypothetical protein BCU94_05535 [Shewanella sp. 10N.286.52.C2]